MSQSNDNLINTLVIAGVGIWGVKQISKLFGATDPTADQESAEIDKIPIPIPPGKSQAPAATISMATAKSIASAQYEAMDQPGTDESRLFSTIQHLNGADLRLVFKAFGRPKYSLTQGRANLFQWYQGELNSRELGSMRILWYKAGIQP